MEFEEEEESKEGTKYEEKKENLDLMEF